MDALEALLHHNNPPPDLLVGEDLRTKLRDENADLFKRRDTILEAAARMPVITNEDIAGKVVDFIKQMAALAKTAEAKRVDAKEPYLEGSRSVDGVFKQITDPVLKAKVSVERRLTEYLRIKEAEARREREEQERIAREAARVAREEAEAQARIFSDEQSLTAAIEAEKTAETASADLVKAAQAAEVKASALTQTRGEYGSMSSLRTSWVFDEIDRETIDLEALRAHIPTEALDKAVRSYIKAGGRELRGTKIYETTSAVVR